MSTYFEDLAAVRPTQMNIIPRLANMMYDKMMSQLEHTPDGDEHAKAAFKQARPARRRACRGGRQAPSSGAGCKTSDFFLRAETAGCVLACPGVCGPAGHQTRLLASPQPFPQHSLQRCCRAPGSASAGALRARRARAHAHALAGRGVRAARACRRPVRQLLNPACTSMKTCALERKALRRR
jgi:hypothetical protein